MRVTITPYKKNSSAGEIRWAGRFPMKYSRWPENHPIESEKLDEFKARGYNPARYIEGDGMAFIPTNGQDFETTIRDIEECFNFEVERG